MVWRPILTIDVAPPAFRPIIWKNLGRRVPPLRLSNGKDRA